MFDTIMKYISVFALLIAGMIMTTACSDQFDEEIGKMTFPEQAKLGVWQSLGNDTTDFDVLFYLLVNKDGDTINATVYIDPATNRLDFARVGGSIAYNSKTGVTDVLYSASPWDYYYKSMYAGVSTTLQRISIAERYDRDYGLQTAIHLVGPSYSSPPVAAIFANITTYKAFGTPYGKWEDTNENLSTFTATFNPDGTAEVVTPWGDDIGTFSFDENSGTGVFLLENEPEPIEFAYNEQRQIIVNYDGEDFLLCPIEFYSN